MSVAWKCDLCGTKYEFAEGVERACDCSQPRKRIAKKPFEVAEPPPRARRIKTAPSDESTLNLGMFPATALPASNIGPPLHRGYASDSLELIPLMPLRQYSDFYLMPKLRLNLAKRLRPMPEPHAEIRAFAISPVASQFLDVVCELLEVAYAHFSDRIVVNQPQRVLDWILPGGWSDTFVFAEHDADSSICTKSRHGHACLHYKQRVLDSLQLFLRYPHRLHVICVVRQLDYFGQPMQTK